MIDVADYSHIHNGAGAYICGEESAMLDSMEGKRAQPRLKPPFPAVEGLYASPTVINNVETLACVPHIVLRGPDWFRNIGPAKSPGPKLYCLSGQVRKPGLYELPMGISLRELVEDHAGGPPPGRKIKAVIPDLQSQGGEIDTAAILDPSEITQRYFARIQAATAAGGGDPGAGAVVYEDNCIDCHALNGEGSDLGPDLSAISGRGLKFLAEAILQPAKTLTEGYETYVVVEQDGRQTIGLKTRDDADEIDITKATGEVITIAKADIKEISLDPLKSVMPDDLSEAMTVKDYQDVLSFLLLLKGE